jgi:predicted RNase H-like HicB family nuclease
MLTDYISKAMRKARYELLEDGSYYGSIPGFKGVWADGRTRITCRKTLQEVLEEWIVISLRIGNKLPALRGVKPFPKKLRVAS